MGKISKFLLLSIAVAAAGSAALLDFGTAATPPEMTTLTAPFKAIDLSDLPPLQKLEVAASSGPLAYRRYGGGSKIAVIALHGATATSAMLHPLAKRLLAEGMSVYVPDLRGHGETGRRGDIDNVQRMLTDIDVLISRVQLELPEAEIVLAGYSAGGGLALRYGGSPMGHSAHRYVLIAPALGKNAPPPPNAEGSKFAAIHAPRIAALTMLNQLGITAFDGLEAIRFAISPTSAAQLTPAYSFRMLKGMFPSDYVADLRNIVRPTVAVLAEQDELIDPVAARKAINDVRTEISITVVPGLGHAALPLDPAGMTAIVQAIRGENLEDRPELDDPDGTKNPALHETPAPDEAPPRPPQGG